MSQLSTIQPSSSAAMMQIHHDLEVEKVLVFDIIRYVDQRDAYIQQIAHALGYLPTDIRIQMQEVGDAIAFLRRVGRFVNVLPVSFFILWPVLVFYQAFWCQKWMQLQHDRDIVRLLQHTKQQKLKEKNIIGWLEIRRKEPIALAEITHQNNNPENYDPENNDPDRLKSLQIMQQKEADLLQAFSYLRQAPWVFGIGIVGPPALLIAFYLWIQYFL